MQKTCHGVSFQKTKEIDKGGVLGVRTTQHTEYFVGKHRRSNLAVDAARMTRELADKIAALYPEEKPEIFDMIYQEDFDPEPLTELYQVGEEAKPVEKPNHFIKLELAIRDCVTEGAKSSEILNIFSRVCLEGK